MKKDYQLKVPETHARQSVCDQLDLLTKRVEQGLFTAADYSSTVQPYTDRYCLNPQQRFVRGFCRLTIQAMLQKYHASLSHYSDVNELRQNAFLKRFSLSSRSWSQNDQQQAHRVQLKIEQLLGETDRWPVFIEQTCIIGNHLIQLQHAMSWSVEQTARHLIRPRISKLIDRLLCWNQVIGSLERIRQRLLLNQCTDQQIQQMHHNLLRILVDTKQSLEKRVSSSDHQFLRQFIQKVDLSLWLDRLEWLSHRLDYYARHQGVVRTALAWIAQHNRLMNIQRIISESQVVIARIKQWHKVPDSIKQSIAQLERIVFTDLEKLDNDMRVGAKLAQSLNEDSEIIQSD